ncbi:hypothetical protein BIT28_10870 [Photobacterium proteolyticum]|uniref:Lipoprotein n=1 Tax=Photobacterium proteolyticum TaxID=1903952 RepID=A0A1Q9G6W5_9GAMM|nr:hypothetical protein [Photobacterium proteolyticum]OLQ70034.1 hypothetical protein BIT28_10870 [Photobacterium proteolyticum]
MRKEIIAASFVVGSLLLSGCATTPNENYTYKPKALSPKLVDAMHNLAKESNSDDIKFEFIESQSLLIVTIINDDDRFYFETGTGIGYFDEFCNGKDPFYTAMRENGIGMQFNLDDNGVDSYGPWNSDACPSDSQE